MPSSPSARAPRIAVVHDWLDTWGGGENVLAEVLGLYPAADLFTLVDFMPPALRARLGKREVHTSWLQHVPGARRHFRKLLPLFPAAVQSLDVAGYDTIVSISHAVAKSVRVAPGQRHLCYCLTPMRYAWDLRASYLDTVGLRGLKRRGAERVLDHLQRFDRSTAARVTRFAGISTFIAARIYASYDRDATVIYPPVDTDYFTPPVAAATRAHYFTASRWVPYKRIDAIVAAFRDLPGHTLVVAGHGPEAGRVRAAAGPNVRFTGELPRDELRAAMRDARAFLFAAEEDFGIAPLEAQACGTPVIAYGAGAVLETIRGHDADAPTGRFFATQSAAAIADAVRAFEARRADYAAAACRENALRFSTARFRTAFRAFVDDAGAAPAHAAAPTAALA
ncbi:MAG: glycosyltransferase [Proteobacteria bacterium]|nr:glycosyltransferase [Pseudomonadota bacterium]